MEGKSGIRNIDRKSSIETEPRTLNLHQIQRAREAAMNVLSTRSIEEAMSIFTEGMEAGASVARDDMAMGTMMDQKEMQLLELEELQQLHGFRDVVSAPF